MKAMMKEMKRGIAFVIGCWFAEAGMLRSFAHHVDFDILGDDVKQVMEEPGLEKTQVDKVPKV